MKSSQLKQHLQQLEDARRAEQAALATLRELMVQDGSICLKCWPADKPSPCTECYGDRNTACRSCWSPVFEAEEVIAPVGERLLVI